MFSLDRSRQKFSLIFTVLASLIFLCYWILDRELVNFFYLHQTRQYKWLALCAEIPPNIAGVAVLAIYILALVYFLLAKTHKINNLIHIANICAVSVFFKDIAKIVFNRYFPDTWFCNNLSYLQNKLYGFGGIYAKLLNSSFPSGHVTLISSFAIATSYFYPKLFYILIPVVFITILGQVTMYYHFLSDTIAALLLVFIIKEIYCEYLHKNKLTQ